MSLSQRLDVRQSQSLVMTPQLQQAIKLLQMSNQELGDFVAQEIEQNPLLERGDDAPGDKLSESVPVEGDGGDGAVANTDQTAPLSGEELSTTPASEDGMWEQDGYEGATGSTHSGSFDGEEFDPAQNVAAGLSLREHLLGQIHVDFPDATERLIAVTLVEMLDEAGYLPGNLDLARTQLGASAEIFESIIVRLQRLDPPGIFARSLQECLTIQLREKNRFDPAMQVLLGNLELLAKRERGQLMKLCGVDAEDLAEMIAEIRNLNPKPAMAFISDVAPPITPDVMLRAQPGGGWHVELNAENLPKVLVNERYYTQVQNATRAKPDKDYLSERWQQANWLVKALHQRATTILKVAAEIVRRQDDFFVHGVQHLKPLILRDIAEAVEMHESTVSRVTQHKYIATPRGLFELKYFFSAAIGTTGGETMVSAVAVRDRIKALIEAESVKAILSDDRITELLREEGIDVARRTVAKYRESMDIPSSAQRRRVKRDGV